MWIIPFMLSKTDVYHTRGLCRKRMLVWSLLVIQMGWCDRISWVSTHDTSSYTHVWTIYLYLVKLYLIMNSQGHSLYLEFSKYHNRGTTVLQGSESSIIMERLYSHCTFKYSASHKFYENINLFGIKFGPLYVDYSNTLKVLRSTHESKSII